MNSRFTESKPSKLKTARFKRTISGQVHPKSASQQQPNHAKSRFSNTVCLSLARLVDQSDCPQHTLDQQINMYTVFCSVLAWYLHHFQLVLTAFLARILFCFRGFGDARPRIEISSQFSGALSVQVNSKAQGHSIKVHLGQKCPHFVTRLEGNSLDIGLGEFMMLDWTSVA